MLGFEIADKDGDIADRFCPTPGNGGAADMLNVQRGGSQCSGIP
jgi:hypothetical protein